MICTQKVLISMYCINEETKQLAMRLLFLNNDNRDVNMTLQTKTTLETSTKICIFKNQLKGYKSLNDLYTFAEINKFSIFFVPNTDKTKNWIFLDIDSQTKDTEGKRKMLSKDEMKIITQVLIDLNIFEYCTYVVSGTGLHVYLELDFSATSEEFDIFHSMISNSMQNAGIVVDKMNQTHRMRFPGAVNEKYNKKSQVLSAFYSDLKLDKKHFDEFTDRNKKVEVLKVLESNNMEDFEIKKKALRQQTKGKRNTHGIDTRFAYFNSNTGKIATRWKCADILTYFYEANNHNRRNTFLYTLNFLYHIGVFQDTRDLYRKYHQYKRCCIDKLDFAKKSNDFIENDEFFDCLKKSKWVNDIKRGDFTDVNFENSKYKEFFIK